MGGWPIYSILQLLPAGVTRSQRVGVHQVLQIGEIGFKPSLDRAHQERLGQLEKAARFPYECSRDPSAAFSRLEGHQGFQWKRPRYAFGPIAPVRLIRCDLGFTRDRLAEKHADGSIGGAETNWPWRR